MNQPSSSYSFFVSGRRYVGMAWLSLTLFASFVAFARNSDGFTSHIVWWGKDEFWRNHYSNRTNGLAEHRDEFGSDEFITNAVAVSAGTGVGFALQHGGTVSAFGLQWPSVVDMPANLSDIASIYVENNDCWAIKHDGTVTRWGHMDGLTPDAGNVISKLTNVISIISAGSSRYLALEKDGSVLGFNLANPSLLLPRVRAGGELLTNVVALAPLEHTPLVLKSDGIVYELGYQTPGAPPVAPRYENHDHVIYEYLGAESAQLPYRYSTIKPITMAGQVLSNVTSIVSSEGHVLALRKDGTVVAWGNNHDGDTDVPAGLNHVMAIAAAGSQSLALKQNGTVVGWGNNHWGQASVPAGLTNVIAIAAGGDFSLAITTGSIPASVFIRPHGRLEEMEQKADLVFKGQVISSMEITNSSFTVRLAVEATKFNVISVLKGPPVTNVVFEHYAGYSKYGGLSWSGPSPPTMHKFEVGQSYLVFAMRMDKPEHYYSPPPRASEIEGMFRQIADVPKSESDGVLKTLDRRPLRGVSVKEAYWLELNRLLNDSNLTNALYAVTVLDHMCLKGEQYDEWFRSDDFKRSRVLGAMLPLIKSPSEVVAEHALGCFETGTNAPALLAPFSDSLLKVANHDRTAARRLAAIRALSGLDGNLMTNSLIHLMGDQDENLRAGAVALLPRFPPALRDQFLRAKAEDSSPKVRAAVADTIGSGKFCDFIPVLEKLWNDTNNVHTSAGNALLQFDLQPVASVLKAHLNAPDFHEAYLCRLAEPDAGPWLTNLVEVLKARREVNWQRAEASGIQETTNYFHALMALAGDDFKCWNIIYDYLTQLPKTEFQEGKLNWCLDVLEDAGNTGSREPVKLYKLYKTKGLTTRAATFRQENGKYSGFDVILYFDQFDQENTGK